MKDILDAAVLWVAGRAIIMVPGDMVAGPIQTQPVRMTACRRPDGIELHAGESHLRVRVDREAEFQLRTAQQTFLLCIKAQDDAKEPFEVSISWPEISPD